MEVPNDWSAEKSTRNQKSHPVNQKSQPVNQNAEKSTRTQKKCARVALSGKIPLSGTFQVCGAVFGVHKFVISSILGGGGLKDSPALYCQGRISLPNLSIFFSALSF
ncbi:hypothetical protein LR48_Vigan05g083100 [Vigna angularis]|uniref:Uncharacterized protein n=1 Tax=Phaseolus angularis TaxID=3914 RepID=A0A0L9UKX8_PHAAN|nr:hypothetical protein LR48_Vigan05g083100 [Vigna angularis]